jgi:hypothetical protein
MLAVLLFLPVPLLSGARLVWMLAIQGVRLRYWTALKLTFVGNFFNFALPGTTGGDLIKAYYITRYTPLKTEAVTTVFLDRVIGLLSLVLMAAVMMAFTWDAGKFGSLALAIAIICGMLGVGAMFVFSKRLRHAVRLPQLAAKLPFSEQVLRVGRATTKVRENVGLLAASFGITLVLQSVALVSHVLMAYAIGLVGTFAHFFIFIAIGFVIAAIPISPPQAFGVMEWAYVQFFARGELALVNDASSAVALALAVRVTQLLWALPGVLVPLLGAHLPRRDELEELESADGNAPDAPYAAAKRVNNAAHGPELKLGA